MFKCPNCKLEYNTDMEYIKLSHVHRSHKNCCFFGERTGNKHKGLELVLDYYLCKNCIDHIRNSTPEEIKLMYGQDVAAEELKKEIENGVYGV